MAPKINQIKPDESLNNENIVNESINNVSSKGESKLKRAVNNAIAKIWIVLSVTGGVATPEVATSTIVPEAVATITTMAPTTGTALKVITLGTSGAILAACEKPDDTGPEIVKEVKEITISGGETFLITGNQVKVGNTVVHQFRDDVSANNVTISSTFDGGTISSGKPINKGGVLTSIARDEAGNPSNPARTQIIKKETAEKPKCSLHIPEITVSEGDTITQKGKEIFVGTQKIFAWDKDDYTFSTNVKLPYTVSNEIDVTFSLSIKGGQPETRTTKIKVNEVDNNQAPEVTREYPQDKVPNILGGVTVKGDNNQLTFGDVVMYTGKDDNTPVCTISLKLKGSDEEKVGKKISESNTYVLTYTDKDGKSSDSIEFPVKSESIDLTNLNNLNMQVNQEVDLLEGINIPSGIEIAKVEVEIGGQRQEVKAKDGHYLYTPNQPGTCYIYVTEKGEFGNTYVEKSKNPLTIKDIEYPEYQSVTITNIKPVEIFPQISQIEAGDPNIYEYIKNLGVAEVYVMRDMMTKYGTGRYSPEEYQQLLSRMNIGLVYELSAEYQNYGRIGPVVESPYISDHARNTSQNLLSLKGDFTKVKNLSSLPHGSWARNLLEYAKAHPNDIFIFSSSMSPEAYSQNEYTQNVFNQDILDLCDLPNVIIFACGGDTKTVNGARIKKVYNGVYESDGNGMHNEASMANSDKNNYPNSNMRVIIGRNATGNADMTNSQGSVVPIGFNKKSLVSGHPILPYYNYYQGAYYGKLYGLELPKNGTYTVSNCAPSIASETQLIYSLCPDVKDANELLQIIESNTANPDHISLNGETWEIQKYSPINVAKAICIDVDIPSTIRPGEIVTLTNKGYLGSIISIPGAEVKINGQWVAYDKSNESLIKSQNPMYFKEWRLNGDLVAKYVKNGTVTGKIVAVDDKRNGLNVEKEITIRLDTSAQLGMANIQGEYGKTLSGYGEGGYGKDKGEYGKTLSGYGEGGYGKDKGEYGKTLLGYGEGGYGKDKGEYGKTLSGYGEGGYGKNKGEYGKTLSGYGEGGYGKDKGGYGDKGNYKGYLA